MSTSFRILVATILAIGMLALPPLVPAWTPKATFVIIALELLCLQAMLAVVLTGPARVLFMRTTAGSVFLAFLAYLVSELVASGGKITMARRSQASVLSALAGLIVIGWPCLKFAVRGPERESDVSEQESDPVAADLRDDQEPSGR